MDDETIAASAPPAVPIAAVTVTVFPRSDACATQTIAASNGVSELPPGYELVSELGRGGMGVVYLVRQVRANRNVALKMMLAAAHASASDLSRFRTEAEAVAGLNHPNVVPVYEVGEQGRLPFYSMEFCPRGSLVERLRENPFPPMEAASTVEALARGMSAAHARGIVHRDLKPGNVLITEDGSPKITDFGLAKRLDDNSSQTRTGAIIGTPSYMSPEQAAGNVKAIGVPADIYALGAILYECLTGRPPFRGASVVETLDQVRKRDPVPPRMLQPSIPRDLQTICLKCLRKEPSRRYASAAQLADDLRRFQEGRPILARATPWYERAWKAARRRPAATLAIFLAIAGTVAIIAIVSIANANLKRERDTARKAEDDAKTARDQAIVERKKASERLKLAIDTVHRSLVEMAADRWARRPELQGERRRVLEEAVAFFENFSEEDSRDPLVRREKANALYRAGWAYTALGELDRALRSFDASLAVQEQLAVEFPTEIDLVYQQALIQFARGVALITKGDYAEALPAFLQAERRAGEASAADPSRDTYRQTQAQSLTVLGSFAMNTDPKASLDYHRRALQLAEELNSRPNPSYTSKLVLATCLVNSFMEGMGKFQPAEILKITERIDQLFGQLAKESPPTAAQAEMLDNARARFAYLQASSQLGMGRPDLALASLSVARDHLKALIAYSPKGIGHRILNIQVLVMEGNIQARSKRDREALAIFDELTAEEKRFLTDFPPMTWIRAFTAGFRSVCLPAIGRARDLEQLERESADLLKNVPESLAGTVKYNSACGFAQAAPRQGDNREACARKAVALLNELLEGPYFASERNVMRLDNHHDLDPLRMRADFGQFLEAARMKLANKK